MTTYTIDSDDHIATTTGTHKPEGTDHFSSLDELSHLAELWPATRLVRIWNSLPGATTVKRFTDRETAVSRIWKALQNGGGDSSAKSKLRRKNGARSNKPTARVGTKKAHIIRLLERPNGATVAEIMRATDPWPCPLTVVEQWFQAHSSQAPYQQSFLVHYLGTKNGGRLSSNTSSRLCGIAR